MKNFQDIIFIWIRTYREIFKSALVYLSNSTTEKQLTIKTPEGIYWRHSGVLIVNFEHISSFLSVFIVGFEYVFLCWVEKEEPELNRTNRITLTKIILWM